MNQSTTATQDAAPAWTIFDDWQTPSSLAAETGVELNWDGVDVLFSEYRVIADRGYSELHGLLGRWSTILDPVGGEPSYRDWRRFRPLRVSREEDWSDWLGVMGAGPRWK